MLIGSYFGKKVFLITPLVKWYLEHGLKVTHVYEFVQYFPQTCFKNFGDKVSEARRSGDTDPDKAILAASFKLFGNSAYGKTITNVEKHRQVLYCDNDTVNHQINKPLFSKLDVLGDNLYEVENLKGTVKFDLPLQIGFYVYNYAKLRMLQFYHKLQVLQ